MRTSALQRAILRFDGRDPFLFAALGLVSTLSRLDVLLESSANDGPRSKTECPGENGEEHVLMALLGVVALRHACGAHLGTLAPPDPQAPSGETRVAGSTGRAPLVGSLLR
jgi:hypothetical protein